MLMNDPGAVLVPGENAAIALSDVQRWQEFVSAAELRKVLAVMERDEAIRRAFAAGAAPAIIADSAGIEHDLVWAICTSLYEPRT